MAYTGSQAISGRGSVLSINTGTATLPVWTTVGEVRVSSNSGAQWKTADVTNFESGNNMEFITTIRDNGYFKCTCNRVSGDAGQIALYNSYLNGTTVMYQLQLPLQAGQTTKGDLCSWSALTESYDFDVDPEKQIEVTINLKITGPLDVTPGS